MKKFIQFVTASVIAAGLIGSIASAQSTGCTSITITNTGSNNNISGNCTINRQVTATCNGTVYVLDANSQNAVSGDASVLGGLTSGSAITGSATNSNNTSQTVTIGGACGSTTSTTSPSPSVTPVTPGQGATETVAASLPNTAANDTASIIGISLASAAAVVGLSRVAVMAYRRIGNK